MVPGHQVRDKEGLVQRLINVFRNKQYKCLKLGTTLTSLLRYLQKYLQTFLSKDLSVEFPEDAASELVQLEQKNQELREGILAIQQQYPHLQPSLRRVVTGLVKIEA